MLDDKKTYAAITSAKHRPTIEALLPPGSILYVEENPDVKSILAAVYRRNIDVVIIDDDGLPYKPENEADVYAFPAMQTSSHRTQAIFLPASDRETGDPFLSNLVTVGIYDIMDPFSQDFAGDLARFVAHPNSFADAMKWFNPDLIPAETASRRRNKDKQGSGKIRGLFSRKGQEKDDATQPTAFDTAEATITVPEAPSPLEDMVIATGKTPLEQLREQLASDGKDSIPVVAATEDTAQTAPEEPTETPTGPIPGKRIQKPSSEEQTAPPEQKIEKPVANREPVAKPEPESKAAKESLSNVISRAVSTSAHEGLNIEHDEEGLPVIPASTIDVLVEQVTERIGEELMSEIEKRAERKTRAKDLNTRTIAVASLEHGAGATHLVLATTQFLATRIKGQQIGCALCNAAELNSMSMLLRGGKSAQGHAFKARGVTYALLGDDALEDVQWLVEDCGVLSNEESTAHTAFAVAGLKCVVVQGDPWKAHQNSKALEHLTSSDMAAWTWCFRNASDDYATKFLEKACPAGKNRPGRFMIPADDGNWWSGSAPEMSGMLGNLLPAKYRTAKPNNNKPNGNKPNQEKKAKQKLPNAAPAQPHNKAARSETPDKPKTETPTPSHEVAEPETPTATEPKPQPEQQESTTEASPAAVTEQPDKDEKALVDCSL